MIFKKMYEYNHVGIATAMAYEHIMHMQQDIYYSFKIHIIYIVHHIRKMRK